MPSTSSPRQLSPVSTVWERLPFDKPVRLATAIAAAHAAASVLLEHFERIGQANGDAPADHNFKTGSQGQEGLVTAADLAADRAIGLRIRGDFPEDGLWSEEGQAGEGVGRGSWWIVDPLDGTNNFACGVPQFSVSIAYCEAGVARLGVVVDPVRDDWYIAVEGQGAWLNDCRAKVHPRGRLEEVLIGFGFYYDRGALMRATLASLAGLFEAGVLGVRRFGSAALDLCQVGVGRFGGFFEYTLSPWDFAAGALFVREAGGQVSDCSGQPLSLVRSDVLASNGLFHPRLVELVAENLRKARHPLE